MVFPQASFDEAVWLYTSYCKARGLAERTLGTYTTSALKRMFPPRKLGKSFPNKVSAYLLTICAH